MKKKKVNYKLKYYNHYGLDKCDIIFCKVCGKVATNLHHIKYKSQGGSDEAENLLPMCYKCHAGHHERNNPTTEQIKIAKENYTHF